MNVPNAESHILTPHTPHATLIPLQGTTPTNLITTNLTHAGVSSFVAPFSFSLSLLEDDPSSARLVTSNALGKNVLTIPFNGQLNILAHKLPHVVKNVICTVATPTPPLLLE